MGEIKTIITTQVKCFGCKNELMTSASAMEKFLNDLVSFIGMQKIPEEFHGKNPNCFLFNPAIIPESEEGVTGVVTLFESHAAAHSWPKLDGQLYVIVSSCKEYSSNQLALWVAASAEARGYNYQTIRS